MEKADSGLSELKEKSIEDEAKHEDSESPVKIRRHNMFTFAAGFSDGLLTDESLDQMKGVKLDMKHEEVQDQSLEVDDGPMQAQADEVVQTNRSITKQKTQKLNANDE